MPFGRIATFRATVSSDVSIATFRSYTTLPAGFVEEGFVEEGFVESGASSRIATFTADVSRELIDSYDGPGVFWDCRVVIDGVEVPAADLVGPVKIRESIETHLDTAEFSLVGERWSMFSTLATWTKTPVEIYVTHGQAWRGEQAMTEKLEFAGYILPRNPGQTITVEPIIQVRCGNRAALFDRAELCHEVEPYAGLTRGAIARELAADVGIASTVIPDGAVYEKAVFTDQKRLFEFLQPFGEPEGWHWKMEGYGPLEAYTAEVKETPQPPDHVWTADDVETISAEGPGEVPSRWIARCSRAILLGADGIENEISDVKLFKIYSPEVATDRQDTSGVITATGFVGADPVEILFYELVQTIQRREGDVIAQRLEQFEWFWPMDGKLQAPGDGASDGPGPDGYNWRAVYLAADGSARAWPEQRFVRTAAKVQQYVRAGSKRVIASSTIDDGWTRIVQGVKRVEASPPPSWASSAIVGDDGKSYAPQATTGIEVYQTRQRIDADYSYDATNAEVTQEIRTFEPYAIKGSIDTVGNFLNYDGSGQDELTATMKKIADKGALHIIDSSGRIRGEVERESGYTVRRRIGGSHDWGAGVESDDSAEVFAETQLKQTLNTKLGLNTYEKITIQPGKSPTAEIIQGKLPLARFGPSAWTRLAQEPVEVIFDDDLVEELFGFSRRVLQSEFAQSAEELGRIIRTQRGRALARKISITRPQTLGGRADTVLLLDPRQGLAQRCLVIARERTWDLTRGRASAAYTLEAYL